MPAELRPPDMSSDQVPGGIPDEELDVSSHVPHSEGDSVVQPQPESQTPIEPVTPTIDPLDPGEHPEVDAWFADREQDETRRRREARAASFYSGGSYRRNRLLGR